jgi:uronate dehydrogenase
MPDPNVVVLTGAAGRIGSVLRTAWRGRFRTLRLVDVQELHPVTDGEEAFLLNLADLHATRRAMEGADSVVHLAAIPNEDQFHHLLEANIDATFNVFEAARQEGVRRIVFASSNHVTGFYDQSQRVGPEDPVRPDTLYAVTKVFGEALGRLYADKWQMEVACLRIGAFAEHPKDAHALRIWLSPRDAVQLFTKALTAPDVRFLVVYGLSKTRQPWWDNPGADVLGYEADDKIEPAVSKALEREADPASSPFQGGPFAERDYWRGP